jgi:hypothetical protein
VNKAGCDAWIPWPYQTLSELRWWTNNKREYPSFISETFTTTGSNNNRYSPRSMGCNFSTNQRRQILQPRKKIRLTSEQILKSTITEDGKIFCLTNMDNPKCSYRPVRFERKTKIPKRLSNSPTEIEQENSRKPQI